MRQKIVICEYKDLIILMIDRTTKNPKKSSQQQPHNKKLEMIDQRIC
jgi:hypothetical protein